MDESTESDLRCGDATERGEDHAVVLEGDFIVAGDEFDGGADRSGTFNDTKLTTVSTHEGQVARGAVALSTAFGDLSGIILIPVAKGLGFDVVVR